MWTAAVSSLKDKAVALRERLAAAERSLVTEREKSEQLQAQLSAEHLQLAAARVGPTPALLSSVT